MEGCEMETIKRNNKGITFIEVAIVLLMAAIMTSTIAVGRDVIRSAEIRSVITDFNSFEIAINTFEVQYNSLPGDMEHATKYWAGTENGNGDNLLDAPVTEGLRAWQQLTLSTILDGYYTGQLDTSFDVTQQYSFLSDIFVGQAYAGPQPKQTICHLNNGNGGVTITVANPSVYQAHLDHGDLIGACADNHNYEGGEEELVHNGKYTVGKNVPAARMKNAGFRIDWTGRVYNNSGNHVTLATESNPLLSGSAITPHEAWIIDDKIDDGFADTGDIVATNGDGSAGCVIGNGMTEGVYNNALELRSCQLHFFLN